ncbi:MAG: diguanylate cyclase (GGDEF)-like protein/PAS domain S-box-containing protein [Cellvibrionaceae bacterium]|jgi:diguanylate cyclase (GGDEF)-like protein/PAS domain S-box-containing protein
MNSAIVPFRLLIINDSQLEAQRLISMFQNAGKPCRAQYVNSEAALNKVIEEQSWDLAIALNECTGIRPVDVIRTIRKHNHDLPTILLTDSDTEADRSIMNGMKLGACDVVKLDDDQHLLLVVSRELENRQQRKITRASERKVKELERCNRQLLNSSKDGIAFIQDGMIIYANDSFAEMAGYSTRSDIEYLPIMDMIDSKDQQRVKSGLKGFSLQNKDEKTNRLNFHVITENDDLKKIDCELQLAQFEDEPCIQLLLHTNFSGNEVLEAEIENIKTTDNITGLNNKTLFNDKLSLLISNAAKNEVSHSFFYIDIDQFEVNVESLVGIDGADDVLAAVAGFLRAHSRTDDFLARIGDHSFAILTDENHLEKLLNTGNILCDLIRDHFFEVNNKTLRITCSIGIVIINETSIDAQSVINQANQVIESLRKKNNSAIGDGVNVYQTIENDQTVLVSALQKAIKNNDFKLLFQPIISLRGDETERYEVLLRMLDEYGEEVSPTHFWHTAESMRTTTKIDRWVILESIKHLSGHSKKSSHVQLIVNLSHQTLCDESLLPWLKVAFKAAKVDPSTLTFQAKESDVAQHLTAAKKFIDKASSIGVDFSINQFGCALEPLSLLGHIDVKHIKIDGSFTVGLQDNTESTEVMSALLKSLHERGKITTIPLVENASILSKLWKMGAHCIQGHYLQPPSMAMDYEFSVESTG